MRLSKLLGVIGATGLAVLATSHVLHIESDSAGPVVSAHEKELQQENERLRRTVENLTAEINRDKVNPDQQRGTERTVAAPPPSPVPGATTPDGPRSARTGSPAIPMTMAGPTETLNGTTHPTPDQSAFFEKMKQRFDDPTFVSTLNLSELARMKEMKSLPAPMQKVLLAKAIQKYNRGEVDERTFLSGMPGYPQ